MARRMPESQRPTGPTSVTRPEPTVFQRAADIAGDIVADIGPERPAEPAPAGTERLGPDRIDRADARPATAGAAVPRARGERPRAPEAEPARQRTRPGRLWMLAAAVAGAGGGAAAGAAPTGLDLLSQRPGLAGAVAALATVYIAVLTTLREIRDVRDRRTVKNR